MDMKGLLKMTSIMNDEYVLERGYKKYDPTGFDNDSVVLRFQKRFDDKYGKKYFIDILKWSYDFIPVNHRDEYWKPFGYTFEIYTTMFDEEKCLNMEFYSNWTLEEIEQFAEDFFEKMKPNYYETWDGKRYARPQ